MSNISRYTAFSLEAYRSGLAKQSAFTALQKTYRKEFAEIKDENSPELWDILNVVQTDDAFQNDPMAIDRVRYVSKYLRNGNGSILNVGFGSGSLEAYHFRRKVNHSSWYGIDISGDSVVSARKRFPACFFQKGTILDIYQKDNSFDYVVALEVLEHIRPKNTFKALRELWRVTKPGGHVIVSVPLNEGLEELVKSGINPNAHVRVYSPELIKAELQISGFKIISEELFYAFSTFYKLKSFVAKHVLPGIRRPNNIVVIGKKHKHKK